VYLGVGDELIAEQVLAHADKTEAKSDERKAGEERPYSARGCC